MQLKDYYTILELPPSASTDEIKRAYRRLAHQYHPDKNPGDPYAQAQFAVIKEAYETLVHPRSKEQYLQQRWYARSMGKKGATQVLTPTVLLRQVLKLDRYVHSSDIHRMEQEGLYGYIAELLSPEHIELLNRFNEVEVNLEIILGILRSSHTLPAALAVQLAERLKQIKTMDTGTQDRIDQWVIQRQRIFLWDKTRTWLILAVALLLCLLIFILSGK